MDNSIISNSGGCMCGAVAFRVTAEPYFTAICSCTFCQKLTGTDYNVEAMFRESQFELTKGATTTFAHTSEGSGMSVHIHFCQTCGTSMFLRPDRFPDCVGIFAGAFDNPSWLRRGPEAVAYFFTEEAPTGMVIPSGFKTYPGHAIALDGSPNNPIEQAQTIIVK